MAKKVLVLGAGLIARPMIRFILEKTDYELVAATRTVSKAERMIDGHPRGRAVTLDVSDKSSLSSLVADCDIAVSLVPYAYHPGVARLCLDHKKEMVTTSYVSQEMRAFDDEAKKTGIIILNEVGLDPGIDHMSAKKIIDSVQGRGGRIVSFESMTGALPSPEGRSNPFGYKFSWSPRGVLLASGNSARFLKNREIVDIPGADLFSHYRLYSVESAGWFEDYPNRDSVPYRDIYGIEDVETMYRGTLRNLGWCETLLAIARLGLLEGADSGADGTYRTFLAGLLGAKEEGLEAFVADRLAVPSHSAVMKRLVWLGLFDETALPADVSSPLDVLASLMFERLLLPDDETDMVVMQHEFMAAYPDGKSERIFSTMVDFGKPGADTSVARTVSLPSAMAVKLILEGKIDVKGVHIPVLSEIYDPILTELKGENIRMTDIVRAV